MPPRLKLSAQQRVSTFSDSKSNNWITRYCSLIQTHMHLCRTKWHECVNLPPSLKKKKSKISVYANVLHFTSYCWTQLQTTTTWKQPHSMGFCLFIILHSQMEEWKGMLLMRAASKILQVLNLLKSESLMFLSPLKRIWWSRTFPRWRKSEETSRGASFSLYPVLFCRKITRQVLIDSE